MTEKDPPTRAVEGAIRAGIVAVFLTGVRRRDPAAVVNAALALAASFLPDAIERRYEVRFRPWQRIYAEAAMLTHAAGMLGPYDDTWWWDHLTHTHSATLLAGIVHVAARRRGKDPRPRVLAAIVLVGVAWELTELLIHWTAEKLGLEPLLVSYGERDTLLDLGFDVLGALLVLAFGERFLKNFLRA